MSTNTPETTIQLETTPRVYYEHYMTAQPSYDLYPSLSRRLGNGYVPRPIRRPKKQQQQTNFISIHGTTSRRSYNVDQDPLWQPTIPQIQQETPSWDLYPAILRNVENYGTDQMRQRLHVMEATVTTL